MSLIFLQIESVSITTIRSRPIFTLGTTLANISIKVTMKANGIVTIAPSAVYFKIQTDLFSVSELA